VVGIEQDYAMNDRKTARRLKDYVAHLLALCEPQPLPPTG
jgi:hypothetical protein